MLKLRYLAAWSSLLVMVVSTSPVGGADFNEFLDFSAPTVPGRLYVPPDAMTSPEPRPLILFLHGAGETGTNNTSQVNGNIDNLFDEAKARGAFLYAPQATTFTWADGARTSTVMDMIDQAISQYNVDADRLYVTGLSMGGGGAWNMLNRFDDRFAAGVPIAAVTPGGDFNAANLVGKPTWAFHARNDGTVPTSATRGVVAHVLSAASAATVIYPSTNDLSLSVYQNDAVGMRFTEFATGGHGIWGPVYDTPEMYQWLFAQELSVPPTIDPSGGAQVIFDNVSRILPVGDPAGVAIPAGSGFVSVGSFDRSDAEIAATNATSLSDLANSFTQFGASLAMGRNNVEGLFAAYLGAPLAADDPLIGQSVYLVVGDGGDIEDSDSLLIFKSDQVFASANPSSVLTIALDGALDAGEILLGSRGTVTSNRLGARAGILTAPVNVPEPASGLLVLFAAVSLCWRHVGSPKLCDHPSRPKRMARHNPILFGLNLVDLRR